MMAAADYYLCDGCGCKTFYDANLPYGDWGDDMEANPRTGHPWPDSGEGIAWMFVLCPDCEPRVHELILQIESLLATPKQEEEG